MRPSPATQSLLRIGFWHEQVRYCITVALEARKRNVIALNADWWLDRAKLHAKTMRLHLQAYAATV